MKPHEQVWEDDGEGAVWNKGRVADLVHVPTEGHAQSEEEVFLRGRLISAAPDMARALLGVLEIEQASSLRFVLGPGRLADIRAALRKAGVLP